jgi:NADH dehydrogenase (ubiquinone) 1 alpha/beta subcomplex 1, acyl-carrier protein
LDRKEVAERVVSVLRNFEKVDAAKLNDKAHFSNDLGLDSLDAVEVSSRYMQLIHQYLNPFFLLHLQLSLLLFYLSLLSFLQVCMALEEEFCITIPDAEAEKILSVEDAVNFIATHPQAR